jgi:hypothetical protein
MLADENTQNALCICVCMYSHTDIREERLCKNLQHDSKQQVK